MKRYDEYGHIATWQGGIYFADWPPQTYAPLILPPHIASLFIFPFSLKAIISSLSNSMLRGPSFFPWRETRFSLLNNRKITKDFIVQTMGWKAKKNYINLSEHPWLSLCAAELKQTMQNLKFYHATTIDTYPNIQLMLTKQAICEIIRIILLPAPTSV